MITALTLVLAFAAGITEPVLAVVPNLTVHLFESHKPPQMVTIKGPFTIVGSSGLSLPAGNYRLKATTRGLDLSSVGRHPHVSIMRATLELKSKSPTSTSASTSKGLAIVLEERIVRHYMGTLKFALLHTRKGPALSIKNVVDSKDYVYSVVGSESLLVFPPEALKAQAVLTFTRVAKLSASKEVGDSTQEEAYFGSDFARQAVRGAVDSVWGQVLTYDGAVIKPFYHSTCAGQTSSGLDVFGAPAQSMHYLQAVKCKFCMHSPFWKETTTYVPHSDFARVFGEQLPVVLTRDSANRPKALKLTDSKRYHEISGYQFWIKLGQNFGWDKAPGTRFSLSLDPGDQVKIQSTGAGHGVGLCQWGACQQARDGKTYAQILGYYFPGSKLDTVK